LKEFLEERLIQLVAQTIKEEKHLGNLKIIKTVVIKKSRKLNHSKPKIYRTILFIKYKSKVIKKVATKKIIRTQDETTNQMCLPCWKIATKQQSPQM
jgi:hypothetical protein